MRGYLWGGFFFSAMVGWAMMLVGVCYALITTVSILLTEKRHYIRVLRVLFWLAPIMALLFISSEYAYLLYYRPDVPTRGPGHSYLNTLRYLPPDFDLFSGESVYPTATEANNIVTELRISTSILLAGLVATLGLLIARLGAKRRSEGRVARITPWGIAKTAGVLIVISYLVFEVVLPGAPHMLAWFIGVLAQ